MIMARAITETEKELIRPALMSTWGAIAPDVIPLLPQGRGRPGCIAEMVCDANRVAMYGGKNAAEADKIIGETYLHPKTQRWLRELFRHD